LIGAGTGGITVAKQLEATKLVKPNEITIFDSNTIHHYQPGWTKIGGGVFKSSYITNNLMQLSIPKLTQGFNYQNKAISKILPEENAVVTNEGEKITYEHLIVAAGLKINLNSIPGFYDLFKDPSKNVSTVYDREGAFKMAKIRENFKGGRAIFTQPTPPIKCGGAPQKMAFLSEDYWKKRGIEADVHFFTPLPQMFAVDYFSDALYKEATRRGITPHFTSVLIGVKDGIATFKNTLNNSTWDEPYDLLHVVPHMSAPDLLIGSAISNANNFVDIDATMRHKKYSNVWAVGDCVGLPQAKTAAALFSQAPVLVENLTKVLENKTCPNVRYDGYSSCPLFVSQNRLLLAEFREMVKENGEIVKDIDESIHKGKQNVPAISYFYITKSFAFIYPWLAMKGKWFGKSGPFRPDFYTHKDHRWIYGLLLNLAWITPIGLIILYSL
jgi:sulfide:quinone oxidoreductase